MGSPVPPNFKKLFLSGCRRRPSEKTAIQVRYVQPFSVATLKWGLEGATKVRSLSRAMAVFFEEPGEDFLYQHSTTSSLQDEVVECWYKKFSPDWNEGHCQSLPALPFRTLRTLADIRTKDAKYHGSNPNYKLEKKVPMVLVWQVQRFGMHAALLCGRC